MHEFLLLILNLAQMKRKDRIVEVFQQAWIAHVLSIEMAYSDKPVAGKTCEEIATHKNTFGFFILRNDPNGAGPEIMPLARNMLNLYPPILVNL